MVCLPVFPLHADGDEPLHPLQAVHLDQEEVLVTAAFLLQLHLARLLHVSRESALVTFPHGLAWLEFLTGTDF